MKDSLFIKEKEYISSRRAREITKYSQDYIGQLARAGLIDAQIVGRSWFVSKESILNYLAQHSENVSVKKVSPNISPAEILSTIAVEKNLEEGAQKIMPKSVSPVQSEIGNPAILKQAQNFDDPFLPKLIKKPTLPIQDIHKHQAISANISKDSIASPYADRTSILKKTGAILTLGMMVLGIASGIIYAKQIGGVIKGSLSDAVVAVVEKTHSLGDSIEADVSFGKALSAQQFAAAIQSFMYDEGTHGLAFIRDEPGIFTEQTDSAGTKIGSSAVAFGYGAAANAKNISESAYSVTVAAAQSAIASMQSIAANISGETATTASNGLASAGSSIASIGGTLRSWVHDSLCYFLYCLNTSEYASDYGKAAPLAVGTSTTNTIYVAAQPPAANPIQLAYNYPGTQGLTQSDIDAQINSVLSEKLGADASYGGLNVAYAPVYGQISNQANDSAQSTANSIASASQNLTNNLTFAITSGTSNFNGATLTVGTTTTNVLNVSGNASISGVLTVAGQMVTGNSNVSGTSTAAAFTATSTTATSSFAGNFAVQGNTLLANATSTNFFATLASTTNLFANNANLGETTLTDATATNFFAATASSTNLFATNLTAGAAAFNYLTTSSTTATSTFAGNLSVGGNLNFNGALLQNGLPFVNSQWTTSGSNIYYTTGNVGIGTTSPYLALSVSGSSLVGGTSTASAFIATSTTATSTFAGNLSVGGNLNFNGTFLQNGSPFVGSQWTTSGSNIYYTTGNVGIGTTSPYLALSVSGSSVVGGTSTASAFVATSSSQTSSFAGNVAIGTTNATAPLTIYGNSGNQSSGPGLMNITASNDGNYVWGAVTLAPNLTTGHILLTQLTGVSESTNQSGYMGFKLAGGGSVNNQLTWGFYSNDQLMVLDTTGDLGVGTTSPGTLLSLGTNNGINFSLATSTFYSTGGINLTNGCYAIGGNCLGFSNLAGTLAVASGGTGANAFGQGWIYSNGGTGALNASTSPTVNYITATSTTVASSFFNASTTNISNSGYSSSTNAFVSSLASVTGKILAADSTGKLIATTTIAVPFGGTGAATFTGGQLLYGNTTAALQSVATSAETCSAPLNCTGFNVVGTGGGAITLSNLTVTNGGTGATTFGQGWIYSNGGTGALSASTSPTVNYLTATSTTIASTFAYNVGIGTTTPFATLSVSTAAAASATSTLFAIASTTNAQLFTVLANGMVGINNASPAFNLDIGGNGLILANVANTGGYGIGGSLLAYASSTNQDTIFGIGAGGNNATTSATVNGNTAIGYHSGSMLTTNGVEANTAVGEQTLQYTTTGTQNVAIGGQALGLVAAGSNNTAVGFSALSNDSGSGSIGIGISAGNNVTGNNNIIIGDNSFLSMTSGHDNIGIGNGIDWGSGINPSNQMNIGNVLFATNIYSNQSTRSSAFATNGNIGIGTSTPFAKLAISLNPSDTDLNAFLIASSTSLGTSTLFTVLNNGNVGVGSSTPWGQLSVNPNLIAGPSFVVGSSTALQFIVANNGNVGIGTTSPYAKLSIVANDGGVRPYLAFSNSNTSKPFFQIASSTNFQIDGGAINPTYLASTTDGGGSAPFLNTPFMDFISGNYLYVASFGSNALEIIDVSNPANPQHVGSLTNGTGGALLSEPTSVFVSGNYAYVTSFGSNALEIVDVSNPSNPVHRGSISDGSGSAPFLNHAYDVYVSGNYAYVASRGSNALEIIDVSDPANPVHKGSIVDGLGSAPYLNNALAVYVAGNYAYVTSSGSASLEIVDVSNPAKPIHKGDLLDGSGSAPFLNTPVSIFVSGKYAYIASDGSSGVLEIVDVSNPNAPVHAGDLVNGTGGAKLISIESVFVAGNYAYLASNGFNALEIVNIASSTNPVHSASITNTGLGTAQYAVVSGNYAYVIGQGNNDMEVVDVGGANISNEQVGSAKITNLQVSNFTQFNQNVLVGSGLNVGGNTLIGGTLTVSNEASSTSFNPTAASFLNGNVGIGTTSPGTILSVGNTGGINFTTATSSFYTSGGINITAGCFAVNNVCVGGSTSAVTTNTGTTGWIPYYSASNVLTATSSLFISSTGNVGIGTTTPFAQLSVSSAAAQSATSTLFAVASTTNKQLFTVQANGNIGVGTTSPWAQLSINPNLIAGPSFVVGSSTAMQFIVANNGNVGVGTTSPFTTLSVNGTAAANSFIAASSTATSTFAGGISVGDSTQPVALFVTNTGNVAIGTSTPATLLDVGGDITDENLINCDTSSHAVGTDSNGKLVCDTTLSDERLKDQITSLDATSSLALVNSLNPVSFYWKDPSIPGTGSTQEQFGFIAQEVNQVAPNLVATTSPTYLTPDGTFYLNYQGIIPVLAKAIQAQQSEINNATTSISTLTVSQTSLQATASTTAINLTQLSAQVQSLTLSLNTVSSSLAAAIGSFASSTADMASSTANLATTTAAQLSASQSFIQQIATAVQNFLATAGNWIISKLTATTVISNTITTDTIQAQTASITNGLEMTDAVTGQVYCVRIRNGSFSNTFGQCLPQENTSTPAPVTASPAPADSASGSGTGSIGSTTSATGTPDTSGSSGTATSTSDTSGTISGTATSTPITTGGVIIGTASSTPDSSGVSSSTATGTSTSSDSSSSPASGAASSGTTDPSSLTTTPAADRGSGDSASAPTPVPSPAPAPSAPADSGSSSSDSSAPAVVTP